MRWRWALVMCSVAIVVVVVLFAIPQRFSRAEVEPKLRPGMTPREVELSLGLSSGSLRLGASEYFYDDAAGYGYKLLESDWRSLFITQEAITLVFNGSKRLVGFYWELARLGDEFNEEEVAL